MASREKLLQPANSNATSTSPSSSPKKSSSLQLQHGFKSHNVSCSSSLTEIPPRARHHKQSIPRNRRASESRSPMSPSLKSSCREVMICQSSPKVLPPIRGSEFPQRRGSFDDEVRESRRSPKFGKLTPLEQQYTKRTSPQAPRKERAIIDEEYRNSSQNTAKRLEWPPAAMDKNNSDSRGRRWSQPNWSLFSKGRSKVPNTMTLDELKAIYWQKESQGLLSDSAGKSSTKSVSQGPRRPEDSAQGEIPKTKSKNYALAAKEGKVAEDNREVRTSAQCKKTQEKKPESFLEVPCVSVWGVFAEVSCSAHLHCKTKRIGLLAKSSENTQEIEFVCKFTTTLRTNNTERRVEPVTPALETLHANLIVSRKGRRNAICEVLEQKVADREGSLFDMRRVLANSFA